MNLDNRENYQRETELLCRLSLRELKAFVGELYKIRFEDQDIEVDAYYRLASHVLNRRKEKRQLLTFHLKNLVVSLIIISYLYNII
jgi:hypothetical protein